MAFDKGGLIGGESTVSNRSETRGVAFGGKFREVVDQGNRSELRDEIRTLDFWDEGDNSVVKPRYVNRTQTESLDDRTNKGP